LTFFLKYNPFRKIYAFYSAISAFIFHLFNKFIIQNLEFYSTNPTFVLSFAKQKKRKTADSVFLFFCFYSFTYLT